MRFTTGVPQRGIANAQAVRVRTAWTTVDLQRVWVNGEESSIQSSMVQDAKDQTVARIVAAAFTPRPDVSRVQQFEHIHATHGAPGSVPP